MPDSEHSPTLAPPTSWVRACDLPGNPRSIRRWVQNSFLEDSDHRTIPRPEGGSPELWVSPEVAHLVTSRYGTPDQLAALTARLGESTTDDRTGQATGPPTGRLSSAPDSQLTMPLEAGAEVGVEPALNAPFGDPVSAAGDRAGDSSGQVTGQMTGQAVEALQAAFDVALAAERGRAGDLQATFDVALAAERGRVGDLRAEVDRLHSRCDVFEAQLATERLGREQAEAGRARAEAETAEVRAGLWRWVHQVTGLSWWRRRRLPDPPAELTISRRLAPPTD